MRALAVGIGRLTFVAGDTWQSSIDRMLVAVRPVTLTYVSGHPDFSADREPTALFPVRLLFKPLGRLGLTLLAISIESTP